MKTFKIWQTFSNSLLYFSYIFPDQKPKTAEKRCRANLCNQDPSYDNILDNYCQADFGEYFDLGILGKVESAYKRPVRNRSI